MGATASTLSANDRLLKAGSPEAKVATKKVSKGLAGRLAMFAKMGKASQAGKARTTAAVAQRVAGLYAHNDPHKSLHLSQVDMDVKIRNTCIEYVVTQTYRNNSSSPVEATYRLSLPKDVSVFGFEAEIDGDRVVAEIQTKEDAEDTYDDGGSAFMGGITSKGVFEIQVGNLAQGKECNIVVHLSAQMGSPTDGSFTLMIPMNMFPNDPYAFNLKLHAQLKQGIAAAECASPAGVNVALNDGEVHLQQSWKDGLPSSLELTLRPDAPFEPTACVEYSEKTDSTAYSLAFLPNWEDIDPDLLEPVSELVFLIDRSGSMAGGRMRRARETLVLFLNSIPPGCTFNVIGFGSSTDFLFPESVPYNDDTLAQAQQHAEHMEANLGGTNIFNPLSIIFDRPVSPDMPRQVFVLTDGQVSNTDDVIALTERNRATTRVYSFGIGADADRVLVEGLARVGGGQSDFVSMNEPKGMQEKVIRLLKHALEPMLRCIKVEWPEALGKVLQSPFTLRPVFNGSRLVVYGLADGPVPTSDEPIVVKLSGIGPDGEDMTWSLPLDVAEDKVLKGSTISTLAASRAMEDLTEGTSHLHARSVKQEVIDEELERLGLKYSLASKRTFFVAVHEGDEATQGTMKRVTVNTGSAASVGGSSAMPHQTSGFLGGYSGPPPAPGGNPFRGPPRGRGAPLGAPPGRRGGRRGGGGGFGMAPPPAPMGLLAKGGGGGGGGAPPPPPGQYGSLSCRSSGPRSSSLSSHSAVERTRLRKKSKSKKFAQQQQQQQQLIRPNRQQEEKSCVADFEDMLRDEDDDSSSAGEAEDMACEAPAGSFAPSAQSAPAAKPSAPPARQVVSVSNSTDVAKMQAADGSWSLEQAAAVLKVSLADLESALPTSDMPVDIARLVWATALTIAALQHRYADDKAQWQLVAGKARKYVKKSQVKNGARDVDIIGAAVTYVSSLL